MDRLQGWESKLAKHLQKCKTLDFSWGQHDCCLFAADAVMAQTGVDLAARYRNRYSTKIGAARVLKNDGFNDLTEAITAQLGPPLSNPLTASRGDIVVVAGPDGDATGVVFSGGCYFLAPQGLTFRPIVDVKTAWRI